MVDAESLDLSMAGENEILASLSLKSVSTSLTELRKQLVRCESDLADMLTPGQQGTQKFRDLQSRRTKLSQSIEELETVEAQVRLRDKESR